MNFFKNTRLFQLVIFLLTTSFSLKAQIKIEATNVENWIKNNFVGQGVFIGNININLAGKEAIGVFANNGVLQINEGLVISTGDIKTINGINNKYNQSTKFNSTNKPEFDKDLAKIIKNKLFDVSFIEFDFVPYNNSIEFNYQFGSDEYPEYVGSAFNDIFAFFISDSTSSKNIALVPGKNTPVSVNTINQIQDSSYYINNNVFALSTRNGYIPKINYGGTSLKDTKTKLGLIFLKSKKMFVKKDDYIPINPPQIKESEDLIKLVNKNLYQNLQFDGITKKLVAQTYVVPYKRYHLKIIIADVSDNVYDSAVFLEKGSFATKKDITQPNFKDYEDLSGQIDADKMFSRGQNHLVEKTQKVSMASSSKTILGNLNLPVIYFDFDSYEIKESEMDKIKDFVNTYKALESDYKFLIEGHTDNKGNLNYNYTLSQNRNLEVLKSIQLLLNKKVEFELKSKAYLIPKETNVTAAGRAKNRRVEIKLEKIK